jgi:hypothetical protein
MRQRSVGSTPTRCCACSAGGKSEDFASAAQLFHAAGERVRVPTYLVPATQKVWADVYTLPVPGCEGKTAAQIFEEAGCDAPAAPSCAACLGGPKDTCATASRPSALQYCRCQAQLPGAWGCHARHRHVCSTSSAGLVSCCWAPRDLLRLRCMLSHIPLRSQFCNTALSPCTSESYRCVDLFLGL